MRARIASGILLALTASPAHAVPAGAAERYFLGHYAVTTMDQKKTACRVDIAWADDVGGEISTARCGAWPDLAEGLRWWFDGGSGDAVAEDALHKRRFRISETDAGFVAILSDDTHLWLEPVPVRRQRKRH